MKIKQCHFYDYKSIVDTQTEFQPDITCLAGITGSGKTSILKLLEKIDTHKPFNESDLCEYSDTTIKFSSNELKADKLLQFEITFSLDTNEQDRLSLIFPSDLTEITMRRYFDGSYTFDPIPIGNNSVQIKIEQKIKKIRHLLKSLNTKIRSLDGVDSDVLQEFQETIDHVDQDFNNLDENASNKKNIATLKNLLHNIAQEFYYDNLQKYFDRYTSQIDANIMSITQLQPQLPSRLLYDLIPTPTYIQKISPITDEILLDEYLADSKSNYTFHAIGIICGFQKSILNNIRNDQARQENFFNNKSNTLTKQFTAFWSQTEHSLKIKLENNKLIFNIKNTSTDTVVRPSQSSEGIQWILGFFFKLNVLMYASNSSNLLLLDGPATAIHDDAKNDVRKFLVNAAEKNNAQIIYTTHEKALIDPWNLERIRLIEKKDKVGTLIHTVHKSDMDSKRIAISKYIGSPAKYSLLGAPITIFVEGRSDVLIMTALNEYAIDMSKKHLHKDVYTFCDMGGIDKARYYSTLCDGLGVNYCFIVDADNKSRNLKNDLGAEFDDHYISLSEIMDTDETEIEDLIDSELYNKLFKLVYDNGPELDQINSDQKTVTVYNKWFHDQKIDMKLDKIHVAHKLMDIIKTNDPTIQVILTNTLDNYVRLVERIEKKILIN